MTEEQYILLFQKKLSGEISPEDAKQLDGWLAQSPENQKIADDFVKAWSIAENFEEPIDLNLDTDFSLIEKKLADVEKKEAIVRPISSARRKWLRVAAALLLLAVTPFLVKKYLQPAVKYEVATTTDQPRKAPLELPDGSKVWLNAHSEISHFTTSVSDERRVKLTGEAFFEVAEDAERPFIVETEAGKVRVLGTSFSVRNVAGGNSFTVHVTSGRVEMAPDGHSEKLVLTESESGIFDKEKGQLTKEFHLPRNDLFWHTRRLVFHGTPLPEGLKTIGDLFGVKINLESEALKDCPLDGGIFLKSFASAKLTLETMLGAELVEVGKDEYALRGGRCQ